MEFKIITFYLFITALCYIIARIQYAIKDPIWKWKHYIEDVNVFGIAYSVLKTIGVYALSVYLFVSVAILWFKL